MLSETSMLQRGLERLREVLPPGWSVDAASSRGRDGLVRLTAPDGSMGVLTVEAKQRLAPGTVPSVRAVLEKQTGGAPVVFAGWLSRLTQGALREAGIGYLDLTGNLDLRLDRPGLYLRDVGADHDPEPAPSALKSLKGAGAARAVRALVDFVPPYGVRELAAARSLSPDYTALAPEDPAAPAILISRTPSPPALASPRGEIPPKPAEKVENPFRKQLQLLRGTETHNGALMSTASLPAGWEMKMSASKGKPYYWNKVTGETTWVLRQEADIRLEAERSDVWQLIEIRAHNLKR